MRPIALLSLSAAAILSAGCFETSYEPRGIIGRDSIQYSVRDTASISRSAGRTIPRPDTRIDAPATRIAIGLSPDTLLQHTLQRYESIHEHLIVEWNLAKARPPQVN